MQANAPFQRCTPFPNGSVPNVHSSSETPLSKRALLFRNAPFPTEGQRRGARWTADRLRQAWPWPAGSGLPLGHAGPPTLTTPAIKIQVGVVRNVQRMARAPFILLLSGARARPAPWPSPPGSASKFKPEEARWLGARSSPPPSPASLLPPPSRPIRPSFRASELPSWSTARGRSGPGLRQRIASGDPCRSSAWEAQFIALQRCLQTGLSL